MRNYIIFFCKEFQYPKEAEQALLFAFDCIGRNSEAEKIFKDQIELYNSDKLTDYTNSLALMDKVSELSETNRYTVHLLFFICLSQHTRELYATKNIPYDIFYDSMSDLKWKLFECNQIYGIWGSFVAWWFNRFFDLTRFSIGRLQFETIEFGDTYSKNGFNLNPKDIVINVHIPSCGPLNHEDCLAAYKKATEFYKDTFINSPVAFKCSSWLLYPKHKEFLPATSNILSFMSDYDIYSSSVDENNGYLWRIFGTMETESLEKLPRDTSMRRAYADWLEKGNKCGSGVGIFFYNN